MVTQKDIILTVLIPVFNEGINLKVMLKFLKAILEMPHEILVVYDFPEDDSIPVATAMKKYYSQIRLVHNNLGKGVTNAIKKGLTEAQGKFTLILTADDSGPLMTIDDMIGLMEQGCDIVNCTRYAYGGRVYGGSLIARQLSRIANKLFFVFGPRTLTDYTMGVKMLRTSKFKDMEFTSCKGWSVAFEIAIKSHLRNFKLGEIPIISINRFYGGESSFSLKSWMFEYMQWFVFGIQELNRFKKKKMEVIRPYQT